MLEIIQPKLLFETIITRGTDERADASYSITSPRKTCLFYRPFGCNIRMAADDFIFTRTGSRDVILLLLLSFDIISLYRAAAMKSWNSRVGRYNNMSLEGDEDDFWGVSDRARRRGCVRTLSSRGIRFHLIKTGAG